MIERQRSATFVNFVVNHPSVYPWICGPVRGELDLTKAIESGAYIALMGEHGGFLFWHVRDGIFDAHSAVLPPGRGRWAKQAAKDALQWMFEREGAREIMGCAPQGNVAVLALMRVLKFKHRGAIDHGWIMDGNAVPCEIYSMTKEDWQQCRYSHH